MVRNAGFTCSGMLASHEPESPLKCPGSSAQRGFQRTEARIPQCLEARCAVEFAADGGERVAVEYESVAVQRGGFGGNGRCRGRWSRCKKRRGTRRQGLAECAWQRGGEQRGSAELKELPSRRVSIHGTGLCDGTSGLRLSVNRKQVVILRDNLSPISRMAI